MKKLTLWLLPFVVLAVGCGKDKSTEDYQRDKLNENLARYQSVGGTYTGIVTSNIDGRVLGALSLELRAETRAVPGNSGETAIGTPVLVGNMRFLDQNIINFSAEDGYYDPATGLYSADIKITRAGGGSGGGSGGGNGGGGGAAAAAAAPGAQETVKISGNLQPGVLTGRVSALNYPEYGGSFTLRTGVTESLAELLRRARGRDGSGGGGGNQVTTFAGATRFAQANQSKPVHVIVLQPARGTAEDFLDLVSPVRNVELSFNYGQALVVQFPSVVYDLRQGYMTGLTTLNTGGTPVRMAVDCYIRKDENEQDGIRCRHSTNNQGAAAETTAQLNADNRPLPIDERPERSRTIVFDGRGKLDPKEKERKMTLTVTLPARTRYQELIELFFPVSERNVTASFVFGEVASASFVARWDIPNGSLEGERENNMFTANMQCTNFYFDQQQDREFTCLYWTSRSGTITINFKPPFNTGR